MIDRGRRNLLGIAISAVDYEYAVAKIIEDAQAGRRCATTALAVVSSPALWIALIAIA
jgi:hypothetical protein